MDFILDYYNFRIVAKYTHLFLAGIGWTLMLSIICLVTSLSLGVLIALARMSSVGIIWRSAAGYIQFIRATPLLIQIYLVYYGLPALLPFGNFLSETQTGIIALTLHTAPYMAEIIRAGIISVPNTQLEGGLSVGMSRFETMRYIILPQAFSYAMPPLLGQTAILIKDTSLLSIIAVFELMSAGLEMFSETIIATESYITTAVCYLAIYAMMLGVSRLVQNRLGGHEWRTI